MSSNQSYTNTNRGVKIQLFEAKLTIQKQLPTCDLTNTFMKEGYSFPRFDWTSSARTTVGDFNGTGGAEPSSAAFTCLLHHVTKRVIFSFK